MADTFTTGLSLGGLPLYCVMERQRGGDSGTPQVPRLTPGQMTKLFSWLRSGQTPKKTGVMTTGATITLPTSVFSDYLNTGKGITTDALQVSGMRTLVGSSPSVSIANGSVPTVRGVAFESDCWDTTSEANIEFKSSTSTGQPGGYIPFLFPYQLDRLFAYLNDESQWLGKRYDMTGSFLPPAHTPGVSGGSGSGSGSPSPTPSPYSESDWCTKFVPSGDLHVLGSLNSDGVTCKVTGFRLDGTVRDVNKGVTVKGTLKLRSSSSYSLDNVPVEVSVWYICTITDFVAGDRAAFNLIQGCTFEKRGTFSIPVSSSLFIPSSSRFELSEDIPSYEKNNRIKLYLRWMEREAPPENVQVTLEAGFGKYTEYSGYGVHWFEEFSPVVGWDGERNLIPTRNYTSISYKYAGFQLQQGVIVTLSSKENEGIIWNYRYPVLNVKAWKDEQKKQPINLLYKVEIVGKPVGYFSSIVDESCPLEKWNPDNSSSSDYKGAVFPQFKNEKRLQQVILSQSFCDIFARYEEGFNITQTFDGCSALLSCPETFKSMVDTSYANLVSCFATFRGCSRINMCSIPPMWKYHGKYNSTHHDFFVYGVAGKDGCNPPPSSSWWND